MIIKVINETGILVNYTWTVRIWIFILLSTALLCISIWVSYVIGEVPTEVRKRPTPQHLVVAQSEAFSFSFAFRWTYS